VTANDYLAVVAVVVGLGIGAGAMIAARRGARTREQSVRRQRIAQTCSLAIVIAVLTFDAVDTPRHRYLNLALVVIATAGLLFDWLRARRSKTP
jgi:hypothetical protein